MYMTGLYSYKSDLTFTLIPTLLGRMFQLISVSLIKREH